MIAWTRVLLNGELVGGIAPEVDVHVPRSEVERASLRSLHDAGYRFASRGHWHRQGSGRLIFDCGNTLNCGDVRCTSWH